MIGVGKRAAGVILSLTLVSLLPAQVEAQHRFESGIETMIMALQPTGDLSSVNGVAPCSEVLGGVTGSAFSPGLFGRLWLDSVPGRSFLQAIRVSAGYESPMVEFVSGINRFESFDARDLSYTAVETEYRAEFQMRFLRAALELESEPLPSLLLRLGPSIRIPLGGTATETEQIISPSGATFLDRRQTREIPGTTGELASPGTAIAAALSLATRLPLGRDLFFEPTVGAELGLTSIEPDWSLATLRAGVAMGYAFREKSEIVLATPEPAFVEPPRTERFNGTLSIDLEAERLPIELRRQIVARYIPILPVVFFDQGSSEIAERYTAGDTREPSSYLESRISPNAEIAHSEILDVIGSRLLRTPRATVTIVGTTSIDEPDRALLARRRAERIADYLRQRWGIDRARITTRSRIDPAVSSNQDRSEGREENRRVELEFSDESIYRPIQIRSVEPASDPETLSWKLSARLNRPVARWTVAIDRGGRRLRKIEGTGELPSSASWNPTQQEREEILAGGDELRYSLQVWDALGNPLMTPSKEIPLRLDTTVTVAAASDRPDNTAEFLLVTFDFDRAELTARGREELKSILERIGPTSTISVIGYTDATGDSERNRRLAEERAAGIARRMPGDRPVTARGAEPSEAPYSNATPEGRFLSRTVRVVVTDPR